MSIAGLNRLNFSDLTYIGSFGLPVGRNASGDPSDLGGSAGCDFQSGGYSIAYNAANNSLFATCSPVDGWGVCEVAIPNTLYSGTDRTQLPIASYIQNMRRLDPGLGRAKDVAAWSGADMPPYGAQSTFLHSIGLHNGRLICSVSVYYDASGSARKSHFYLDSLNLATAQASPLCLVKVSTAVNTTGEAFIQTIDADGPELHHAGNTSGLLQPIPTEWRAELGNVPFMGGLTGLAIVGRESTAPSAHGFDPDLLSPSAYVRSKLYQQHLQNGLNWGYDTDDPFYVANYGGVVTEWGGPPSDPAPNKRKRLFSSGNTTGTFLPIPGTRTLLETNGGGRVGDWLVYGGPRNAPIDNTLVVHSLPVGHPFDGHTIVDSAQGRQGTGNYPVPRDATNPWTVFPQSTYWERRIRLWDATNFSTVYNGSSVNQDANRPYEIVLWNPPIQRAVQTGDTGVGGGTVDAANRRIYLVGKYDNAASVFSAHPIVNVYTWPAQSPSGPTVVGSTAQRMNWGLIR